MKSRNQVTIAFSAASASSAEPKERNFAGTDSHCSSVRSFERYTSREQSTETQTSGWAHSNAKRAFDFLIAAIVLVLTLPFIFLTAIAVSLTSRGPVLFRQRRVGKGGTTFSVWKFRTMRVDCAGGPSVTKVGDARLTPVGSFLRRFKLDELPQLVNVIRGEMSLVGPRPKLPHHETQILMYRPGITGAASLAFRKEEELLHSLPENVLDDYQVEVMMPVKRNLDNSYMRSSTLRSDLQIMMRTILGKGELIQQSDLFQFQHSLMSLNSALTGANAAFEAAGQRFEESNAAAEAA